MMIHRPFLVVVVSVLPSIRRCSLRSLAVVGRNECVAQLVLLEPSTSCTFGRVLERPFDWRLIRTMMGVGCQRTLSCFVSGSNNLDIVVAVVEQ